MTDMNRIEARMNACSKKQEKAFITYVTAGLPDLAATKEIIRAQERGGCDVIELGVPFSDPVADGPVIQDASYRAICGGVNVKKIFAMMQELRTEGVTVPIIFMMYYNTILHYGVEAFVKRCNEAGVDGLIVPDLPFEEQAELMTVLNASEDTILIQLVSPVREATDLPVMMGFGIRTAADVLPLADLIDGAIVGSYFIRLLEEQGFAPEAAETYCRTFKRELNA